MFPSGWLNVPNSITLFRIALVPVFVSFELSHQAEWALICFGIAAISDGLDGLLARLLNQRTKFGGLLDPIADKILIVAALVSLVLEKRLPVWLLLITLFRDLLIFVGAIVVKRKNLEIPTEPSRIGKYATASMVLLVALTLVSSITDAPPVLRAYVIVVGFIAGLCVVISTAQYFARYGYLWFAPARTVSRSEPEKRVAV